MVLDLKQVYHTNAKRRIKVTFRVRHSDLQPGMVIQKLTLLESRTEKDADGKIRRQWLCRCECGVEKWIRISSFETGTRSCGCVRKAQLSNSPWLKHGFSAFPEYNIWKTIIQRCTDPNCRSFKNYGARGIEICPRWRAHFEYFLVDCGPKPFNGATLDRIDGTGNYEPGNVRWTTQTNQIVNRKNAVWVDIGNGSIRLIEAARQLGRSYASALQAVRRGVIKRVDPPPLKEIASTDFPYLWKGPKHSKRLRPTTKGIDCHIGGSL